MPFRTLASGQYADVSLIAKGDSNDDESLESLTATIDNPTAAYVAAGSAPGEFLVVPKLVPPAGQSVTVNVTLNGVNLAGNPITPLTLDFELDGPPLPPPATHVTVGGVGIPTGPAP